MRVKREGIKSIVFLLFILMSFPVFSATLVSWITVNPNIINENQRYTVVMTVSNLGGGDAPAVTPGAPSGTIGTIVMSVNPPFADIPAGDYREFTWVYQAGPGAAGPSCIIATGTSGSDASLEISCCGSNCIEAKPNPSLFQDIFINPSQASIGQAITIRMNVTNTGGSNAEGVSPGPLIKVGTADFSFVSGPIPLNVVIPPAANQWFTWIYTVFAAGILCVNDNVTGYAQYSKVTRTSVATTSNCITVQSSAALAAQLIAIPDIVSMGQLITVIMSVTNVGVANAVNVVPSPGSLSKIGTGGAVLVAGPSPASISIPGGSSGYFTWTFSAAGTGSLCFSGFAQGTDINSGMTVSSPPALDCVVIQTPASLICGLNALPNPAAVGENITLVMTITNTGQATANSVAPSLSLYGSVAYMYMAGPIPANVTITGGASGYFTWIYMAASTGSLSFSGNAQGIDANSGIAVSSGGCGNGLDVEPNCCFTPTDTETPMQTVTSTPTGTPTQTITVSDTATPTPTGTCVGEGGAIVNPVQLIAGSGGNELVFTYTAGPTTWAGVPGYGTLRITIPAGWSAPSLIGTDPGYFSFFVSGGVLINAAISGNDILVEVRSLAANTGQIIVTYGDKSNGGPGATAGSPGLTCFLTEMDADGTQTCPITAQPCLDVVAASPTCTQTSQDSATLTITSTPTPSATPSATVTCVGEGSAVIAPECVSPLSSGNTIVITYTAGSSQWADWANSGGMVITVPPGWPAPSTNPSDPGYFSVTVTGGVLNSAVVFMGRINVSVSGLQANTGQIIVTYGDKSMGGPGATAPDCGVDPEVFKVETEIDVTMGPLCEIGDSPGVLLCSCPLTPTCTATMTVTQTIQPSATPTITPTETECVGEGNASVNPSGVNPSSTGNTLIFTYTAGPTAWAAAPGYGILRIEIPAGLLALPSTDPSAPGYFTVDVKGGTLTGVAAAGAYIYAYVEGLPANTGIITVTYGDMSGGGPGLTAPPDPCPMGMGIIFPVYSSPGGSSLCRLPALLDPVVFVPCIMPSFTPTSTETLVQDTITVTSTPSKTASPAPSNTNTPTTAMTVTLTVTPAETVTFTLTLTPVFSPTLTITPTQGTGTTLLSIRKTAGGQPPAVGAIITFEIEIRNNDTSPAYNLAVWDTLPSQVELVYDYAGVPKTVDGQYIRWDLSGAPSANPLNPGGIIYIRFDCRITGYSGSVPIANSAGCDYDDASGRHGPIFSEAVFYPVGLPAVYPNPAVDYVKFTNIVPGSQVDIFTLSGEYVNSLDITHLTETWMMNNRFNSRVSPGIYYYLIKDEKGVTRYKGKIFIVRP